MLVITACVLSAVMQFEGLRTKAYWDHGSWAIGYGHHGAEVHRGLVISRGRAVMWLRQDLSKATGCVLRQTEGFALTDGERAALTDFCFNLGEARLEESTLLVKLEKGDMVGAAAEFDRWVMASGHIAPGLVARRAVEKKWFQNQKCRELN